MHGLLEEGHVDHLDAFDALPRGACVAVASITSCTRMALLDCANEIDEYEMDLGDWSGDRYAWKLDDVIELPAPVPAPVPVECRQRIFKIDTATELAIMRQAQAAYALRAKTDAEVQETLRPR